MAYQVIFQYVGQSGDGRAKMSKAYWDFKLIHALNSLFSPPFCFWLEIITKRPQLPKSEIFCPQAIRPGVFPALFEGSQWQSKKNKF